jgi:hypothetical protein
MGRTITATTAVVLMLFLAVPGIAQEVTCADVEFDAEIIANYPEVQEACLDIVEDQGVRYVHLRAKVLNNWISSLTIRYEHPDGTFGLLRTVTPPEGFTAIVNGRPTPVEEIGEGTVMNIFVPEGRWEVAMVDVATPEMAELTFAPVASEEAEEPVAEADQPEPEPDAEEAASADTQAADLEEPSGGISTLGWVLLGGLFVVIVWLLIAKRGEKQEG